MTHARPAYRPGMRVRIGHIRDLTALLLRTGLLFAAGRAALLRQLGTLRRWGTTLGGLVASSAARSPSRPALIDDEGVLTFAELDELAARLAAGLPLHGPRPRVGVLCRNHRGMALTLVACSRRGAEVVLLNTGFGTGQIRAVLGELRPALIVADAEFAPLLSNVPIALRRNVLWADHRPPAGMPLAAPVPLAALPPAPRPDVDAMPAPPSGRARASTRSSLRSPRPMPGRRRSRAAPSCSAPAPPDVPRAPAARPGRACGRSPR